MSRLAQPFILILPLGVGAVLDACRRVNSAIFRLMLAVASIGVLQGCAGSGSGALAPSGPSVAIAGSVDGIIHTGNTFQLTGWACATGSVAPINVQVVVGGLAYAGGTIIGTFPANLASSPSATSSCNPAGTQYGYSIPLPLSVQSNFGATPIYVYGVPPNASAGTQLLSQSGKFTVPQAIWFDPRDSYMMNSAGVWVPFAMADIMAVFAPNSPWPNARSHTQVMDFDVTLIQFGSDSDLQTTLAYLKANNIAFALDAEPLVGTGQCGQGVEGFGAGPQQAMALAQRVQSLGGTIAYMDMDEPFYYGHYYTQSGACQYSVATVAQQAAATMQAVKAVFPNVQVGDAEPLDGIASSDPGWLSAYQQFITDFQADAGFPLTFFHDDATWAVPLNRNIPPLQALLAKNHIPFGMYFEGADNPVSDAGWMEAAEEHIQAYNYTGNAQPAQVLIDTWDPYPTYALPETSPTAMSYLVDFYFSPQALLSPFGSVNQDMVVFLDGAVIFRSTTCSLSALGTLNPTPTSEVEYAYCLVQARAADPAGLQSFSAALANNSITVQGILDDMFTSPEFQSKFDIASMSNSQFVTFLYGLLLFRLPTTTELNTYVSDLTTGGDSQQQVFDLLLQTAEFHSKNPILGSL